MTKANDDRGTWVTLRPQGRGNWKPLELLIVGRHSPPPMVITRGDRMTIAGMTFRVVSVGSA